MKEGSEEIGYRCTFWKEAWPHSLEPWVALELSASFQSSPLHSSKSQATSHTEDDIWLYVSVFLKNSNLSWSIFDLQWKEVGHTWKVSKPWERKASSGDHCLMPPVVLTMAISRWGSTKITRLVNSWKLPALWRTFSHTNYVPLPGSEFRTFCLKISHVSAFTLCPRYSGINYRQQSKQVSRNYLTSLSTLANNIVIECCPLLCRLERKSSYFCSSDN